MGGSESWHSCCAIYNTTIMVFIQNFPATDVNTILVIIIGWDELAGGIN